MYEGLVNNLRKAACRWEKENPIIGVGQLRVQDALRDAARALKEAAAHIQQLEAENEILKTEKGEIVQLSYRLEAERDAAVRDLARCTASHCPFCKNWRIPEKAAVCFSCRYGRARRFEWRGVKEETP